MNLPPIITNPKIETSQLGLDFCSFILRYFRNIMYADFAPENLPVQDMIRTAERFRTWADIEDLAMGYERLIKIVNDS